MSTSNAPLKKVLNTIGTEIHDFNNQNNISNYSNNFPEDKINCCSDIILRNFKEKSKRNPYDILTIDQVLSLIDSNLSVT